MYFKITPYSHPDDFSSCYKKISSQIGKFNLLELNFENNQSWLPGVNWSLPLVISCLQEAPSEKHLKKYLNLAERTILLTSGIGTTVSNIEVISNPFVFFEYFKNHKLQVSSVNQHFLVLSRIPKWHRIALTGEIIKHNLLPYCNISLGSDGSTANNLYRYCGKIKHRYIPFLTKPFYIDDVVPLVPGVDNKKDRCVDHPKFTECFFNVVTESSYEPIWDDDKPFWEEIFITEKTIKPFIMSQVPILLSVPGTVRTLREWGFDVFDDFVNHSYDSVPDPWERIHAVVAEMSRLSNIPIEKLQQYRNNFKKRFEANHFLVRKLAYKSITFPKSIVL